MGSTQGASFIFAHYGAFYGATGGPSTGTALLHYKLFKDLGSVFTV